MTTFANAPILQNGTYFYLFLISGIQIYVRVQLNPLFTTSSSSISKTMDPRELDPGIICLKHHRLQEIRTLNNAIIYLPKTMDFRKLDLQIKHLFETPQISDNQTFKSVICFKHHGFQKIRLSSQLFVSNTMDFRKLDLQINHFYQTPWISENQTFKSIISFKHHGFQKIIPSNQPSVSSTMDFRKLDLQVNHLFQTQWISENQTLKSIVCLKHHGFQKFRPWSNVLKLQYI